MAAKHGAAMARGNGWSMRVLALVAALLALLAAAPARAQPMEAPAGPPAAGRAEQAGPVRAEPASLVLNKRTIVSFRATLLGDTPAERAAMARAALDAALEKGGPGVVGRSTAGEAVRFDLDGAVLFYVVAEDLPGPRPAAMLDAASQRVEERLETALSERREMRDPRRLGIGALYAAIATAVAFALIRILLATRRLATARLDALLQRWQRRLLGQGALGGYAGHLQSGVRVAVAAVAWGFAILVLDLWFTFVLRQFAFTRPWGERAADWLLGTVVQFALAAAGAVPGLVTAVLIFVIARAVARANVSFMGRVERGEIEVPWLDADTAGPTRRLGSVVIWLFALAMAYPYLPGAESEAFKGVSVLAGLMLSLGASGVVGQAMTGLSLMYARVLRVGEYVRIGDTEGTVTAIGLFATKLHTGMGEEVSLPNTVVFGNAIRNFSRLVKDGQFMIHTAVTIGYATPWRQVRAMLLEAARRTPGVAADPPPYVVQTALSDFYVEYRLCAQADRSAPHRRAEAIDRLHANIQDVFNENGVQIMSPHYRSDPDQPQVVPPEAWSPPLRAPSPARRDPPAP
jgi:small-conductance mechanosensitive channel